MIFSFKVFYQRSSGICLRKRGRVPAQITGEQMLCRHQDGFSTSMKDQNLNEESQITDHVLVRLFHNDWVSERSDRPQHSVSSVVTDWVNP